MIGYEWVWLLLFLVLGIFSGWNAKTLRDERRTCPLCDHIWGACGCECHAGSTRQGRVHESTGGQP